MFLLSLPDPHAQKHAHATTQYKTYASFMVVVFGVQEGKLKSGCKIQPLNFFRILYFYSKQFYMDISGKLLQFLPVQTGQGKNGTWKKQEFILETGDTYPKKVCIAVWGDKIDIGSFKPGETIDVSFDVESREFNGRWYTDVKAWKVVSGKQKEGGKTAAASASPIDSMPGDDDLPF
jgi:hypothetical protein